MLFIEKENAGTVYNSYKSGLVPYSIKRNVTIYYG